MSVERSLIEKYFDWDIKRDDVLIGVGDDAAVLGLETEAVVSCDTLVSSIHFDPDTDPLLLGSKALAVNLSDLAAMGARPRHALLALTLPLVEEDWLAAFSRGMRAMAERHEVALVGGNLSKGDEIAINITVIGACVNQPLRQNALQLGDDLWLSGEIGGSAIDLRDGVAPRAGSRLHDPQPRVELGMQISEFAHAAVDLSDGLCTCCVLLADKSGAGMKLNGKELLLDKRFSSPHSVDELRAAACGGMDYELLFSAPKALRSKIKQLGSQKLPLRRIGTVTKGPEIVLEFDGAAHDLHSWENDSFQHFSLDKETLLSEAAKLGQALLRSGIQVSVAESCTAGLLAATMAAVPGASKWLEGGTLAYTSQAKQRRLGVSPDLLEQHGVVSEEVAMAMAEGALASGIAGLGIGITGWAGPEAQEGESVGKVCIACLLSGPEKRQSAKTFHFSGSRRAVMRSSVRNGLNLAHELLEKKKQKAGSKKHI